MYAQYCTNPAPEVIDVDETPTVTKNHDTNNHDRVSFMYPEGGGMFPTNLTSQHTVTKNHDTNNHDRVSFLYPDGGGMFAIQVRESDVSRLDPNHQDQRINI